MFNKTREQLGAAHRWVVKIGSAMITNDGQGLDNFSIDAWVAQHDEAAVLATLAAAEVPASRIYSVADMFADPQFLAREMLHTVTLPDGRDCRMPGVVPKLSATPGGAEWIGPALGEHTEEVLKSVLGVSDAEIASLRKKRVI